MFDINIVNNFNDHVFTENILIQTLIEKLLSDHKISQGSVSIILSNKMLLNKLKIDYFGLNQFTDVIAFNLEDKNEPLEGEIYISIPTAKKNANSFKEPYKKELGRLIIHGSLHLLGIEDKSKEQKMKMTILEEKFLEDESWRGLIEKS